MTASYPGSVYSPRTKENESGVVYDPDETTKVFAEDVTKLDDEVVAVENNLRKAMFTANNQPIINPARLYDFFNMLTCSPRMLEKYSDFGINAFTSFPTLTELKCFAVYNGTIFFFTDDDPAVCYYIKFDDPTSIGYITLPSGTKNISRAICVNGYIYAVTNTSPYRLIKIDPLTLTVLDYLDGDTGENSANSLCADRYNIYIALGTSPGGVVKIYQDTFAKIGVQFYDTGYNNTMDIFYMYGYLYACFYTSPAKGAKIDPSDLSAVQYITASLGSTYPVSITSDGDFLYVGFADSVGHVAKITFDTLSVEDLFSIGGISNNISKILFDGKDLIVGSATKPGKIRKIDRITGDILSTVTLSDDTYEVADMLPWYPGFIAITRSGVCKFWQGVYGNVNLDV